MNININLKIIPENQYRIAHSICGALMRGEMRTILRRLGIKGRTNIYNSFDWHINPEEGAEKQKVAMFDLLNQVSLEKVIEQYLIYHNLTELKKILKLHHVEVDINLNLKEIVSKIKKDQEDLYDI